MSTPLSRVLPTGESIEIVRPATVEAAGEALRAASSAGRAILVRGGGTKWSAGALPNFGAGRPLLLETGGLAGILDYDPAELTITVRAGTPLAEVIAALSANGQYLPFDPPFAGAGLGATIGGTVAAGLNGPRRLRYGGLRDFLIGIHYLDAQGTLVRAGGKVVKNAAGYDFPKLFCGSLGTLGMLTQTSFKVFPRPVARATLIGGLADADAMQAVLQAALRSPVEISAAEAWRSSLSIPGLPGGARGAGGAPYRVAIQVEGAPESLDARLGALRALLPTGATAPEIRDEAEQAALWECFRDLGWVMDAGRTILRVYSTPAQVAALDSLLGRAGAQVVFSLGGNAAWAVLPGDPAALVPGLSAIGALAAVWRSATQAPGAEILPAAPGRALAEKVKLAFDPRRAFYPGRLATL